jgi:hypothetical protein
MDLYLRKVDHPQARNSYRVILKEDGDEIELGSIGLQHTTAFHSAWQEHQAFPLREEQVRGLLQAFLVLLALPIVSILTLALIALGGLAYSQVVPAATAETFIPELKASVRLELYYTLRDRDSGEYLVVEGPYGRATGTIGGVMEWAHWSRTSLYLTDDGKLAVLGTAYEDYIVDPSNSTIKGLVGQIASEHWTYLGAFDGGHSLKFIPASEQRECNATAMHDEEPYMWAARPHSRQERCRSSELASYGSLRCWRTWTLMTAIGPLLPIQHVRCEVGSLSETGPHVLDTRLSHLDP